MVILEDAVCGAIELYYVILYLFQHIPILTKTAFFRQLVQMLSWFIWAGKPACIKKAVLQLPKKAGSMALPNLIQYYWACNIVKLHIG